MPGFLLHENHHLAIATCLMKHVAFLFSTELQMHCVCSNSGRAQHRTTLSALAKNVKPFAVLIMMLVNCSRMSKAWRTLVSSRACTSSCSHMHT